MSERSGGGGGESRRPRGEADERSLVGYEEEARVDKRRQAVGGVRVRREVETQMVEAEYPRGREELVQERVPVGEQDSGEIETLPDGSISVPLFEEELVVTKRSVLRERVIIRKDTLTDWQTVEAELRREHISFHTSDPPHESLERDDA